MKITYVGPIPPIAGGVSQHGANLVEALRSAGHDVEVLSWRAQYPGWLYRGEQPDLSAVRIEGARFALRWWNPLSWMLGGLRAGRSDLIVFPWITPVQAIPLRVLLAFSRGKPAVCVVHNPRPHEPMPFDQALLRLVLRRTRGVVVHGRALADELAITVPGLRCEAVAMPSNLELRPTPQSQRPPLRLLFLGYVRPYKGLDVALEALAVLARRDFACRLTVVGEFWEPVETWADRVRDLGLEDHVELRPGYLPDEEVGPLFAEHHALIAPYRSATQSAVAPMAFAAGRPVVATKVGGLPEAVREGETGTLATSNNPLALAEAIERLDRDLERLTEGASQAHSTWAAVAGAVETAGA